MSPWIFVISIFFIFIANIQVANGDTLRYVHALWRHGDRAPIEKPFQQDQYNESYWPRGWGQLTAVGMLQMHELGEFLRKRYAGTFLSEGFDRKEVYILSTEVDRAIESAQSLLTGMFPPSENDKIASNFNWQPFPIHTVGSTKEDILLRPWSYECHRYRQLLAPIRNESDQKLLHEYRELVEFARPYLGIPKGEAVKMMEFMQLRHIMPEIYHNLSQPDWVNQRWSQFENKTTIELIWIIRALNWLPDFNGTEEISKLIGGVLLADLLERMQTVSNGQKVKPSSKMVLYSTHDNTLLVLLSALKIAIPDDVLALPPYASCIILELYESQKSDNFYVKFFYRRNGHLEELILDGCTTNCPFEHVLELEKPRAIYGGEPELRKICAFPPGNSANSSAAATSSKWIAPLLSRSILLFIIIGINHIHFLCPFIKFN